MKKKVLWLLICLSMVTLVVSGCSSKKESKGDSLKVGVIYTKAKLGGNSFNDLVQSGLIRAKDDLKIEYTEVEPDTTSDQENAQETMASGGDYDLIIAVGQEQSDILTKQAEKYPDQKYAIVDAVVEMDNVASYVSKEEEGSFLIGVLSALSSEEQVSDKLKNSHTFGFIGGVNNPLINKFLAGYEAGVRFVNEDNKVLADYVGGFQDPSTAKVITNTMAQKKADIVYHAAGASGSGMFQAAKEQGILAVGVNTNQNPTDPDTIIASMLKRVDEATFSCIEDVKNDKFKGGTFNLGIKEKGVDYTVEGSNIKIPETIIKEIDGIKEKVSSGELVIPDNVDGVDKFIQDNKK